ncbi:hypothetical protein [Corynebacterium fournieri]|uniref:hypothetical protein n=1 Tax=Corynebacterium fournieri TaxID=1852390 RepID=UPI000A2EF727|nr:hypothetical protein [Corynebacterium fournieri]WJY98173.1 hypothetical protein CFOUR_08865 [Corynebacterium fournieri]
MENISKEEARAALEQVDGIEHATQRKPTPLWVYVILGASFGITIAGTIMDWTYVWALFAASFLVSIGLVAWQHNRDVRPSMKQPIQEEPKVNWFAALAPALLLPLTWFIPEGSAVGAIIAGTISTVVITAVMYYEEKRR